MTKTEHDKLLEFLHNMPFSDEKVAARTISEIDKRLEEITKQRGYYLAGKLEAGDRRDSYGVDWNENRQNACEAQIEILKWILNK
jgi:hypothetical protein